MKPAHLLIFVVSLIAGMILVLVLPPKSSLPKGLQYRQFFSDAASSGERATAVNVSIEEIKDAAGNRVWNGSKYVSLCPGDTVTIGLATPGNGHISKFELANPFSGEPMSAEYPSSYKSEVVKFAPLTLQVPADAALGEFTLRWSAEIYVIQPEENNGTQVPNTTWFQIIAPAQFSGSQVLNLVSADTRAAQSRQKENSLYPQFYKFLGVAVLTGAGLFLARRKLKLAVAIFGIFAGYALVFILSSFEELNYNGLLLLGTLAAAAVVVFLMVRAWGSSQP